MKFNQTVVSANNRMCSVKYYFFTLNLGYLCGIESSNVPPLLQNNSIVLDFSSTKPKCAAFLWQELHCYAKFCSDRVVAARAY